MSSGSIIRLIWIISEIILVFYKKTNLPFIFLERIAEIRMFQLFLEKIFCMLVGQLKYLLL